MWTWQLWQEKQVKKVLGVAGLSTNALDFHFGGPACVYSPAAILFVSLFVSCQLSCSYYIWCWWYISASLLMHLIEYTCTQFYAISPNVWYEKNHTHKTEHLKNIRIIQICQQRACYVREISLWAQKCAGKRCFTEVVNDLSCYPHNGAFIKVYCQHIFTTAVEKQGAHSIYSHCYFNTATTRKSVTRNIAAHKNYSLLKSDLPLGRCHLNFWFQHRIFQQDN